MNPKLGLRALSPMETGAPTAAHTAVAGARYRDLRNRRFPELEPIRDIEDGTWRNFSIPQRGGHRAVWQFLVRPRP